MMSRIPFLFRSTLLLSLMAVLWACNSRPEQKVPVAGPGGFTPWVIEDSSRILKLPSGLRMYIVREGPGEMAKPNEPAKAHFYGTLGDGTVFANTFANGEPFTFMPADVVKGFREGILRMTHGSRAILFIPPALGYGDKGLPPNIPGGSSLIYYIDLIGTF